MSSSVENVVIVGTGCAGLTAAVYTARANLAPLVLEGTLPGGQLTTTSEVENFPGFPEGVDGFQLMDNLRKQAAKFGARFEQARVSRSIFGAAAASSRTGEREILAKTVIIATGASPRLTGVPGEKELYGGKGVTTCATCDGAFYRNMDVAVIGGGDSACEEALFLTRFASKVYLVHRRDTLRASKIMAERTTSHPKIQMVWDSVPVEVQGVAAGAVSGLKVQEREDRRRERAAGQGRLRRHRPRAEHAAVRRGARRRRERLFQARRRVAGEDQGAGRLRRRRLRRPRLPPGGHRRGHGLPGRDRGRALAGRARRVNKRFDTAGRTTASCRRLTKLLAARRR